MVAFFHTTYLYTKQALEDRYYEEIEKSHGCINGHEYRLLSISDWLSGFEK